MSELNFTCTICGGMFERMRPDEEAIAESKDIWSDVPEDELAIVCDDCFKILMEWMEEAVN